MRNKLTDLNNYLFAQLERLDNEELKGTELVEEINRSHAVTEVATQIYSVGSLLLKAWTAADRNMEDGAQLPDMLECEVNGQKRTDGQISAGSNCLSITTRAGKAL